MVEYSIAVCNYNMADTLRESLRSILDQVDDRFEVVVVDGGSDDGSLAILRELRDDYEGLRIVELPADPDRTLGADRHRSIEAARGDHVLPQLDVDDRYLPVIVDFVEIYEQLRSALDGRFYLSGKGINVGPRDLLLEIPYRNLRSAEDRDLWRRLFANDAVRWLAHDEIREEIGYHFGTADRLRRDFRVKVSEFQAGVDFWSCMRWALSQEAYGYFASPRGTLATVPKAVYDLVTFPAAYLAAIGRPSFETPPEFRRRGALARAIDRERRTLSEIERDYDVSIDRDRLSDLGREKFDL